MASLEFFGMFKSSIIPLIFAAMAYGAVGFNIGGKKLKSVRT
jgi:hypothetical protein